MSYEQYIGRNVDVAAYRASGSTYVAMQPAIANSVDGGQAVTGFARLAQSFLLELLTVGGSVLAEPTRGCVFMQHASTGQWRTVGDVFASFAAALLAIRDTLKARETEATPVDERFEDAELLSVTLLPTEASVTIQLTSEAGSSQQIIAPLTTFS